MRREQVAIGRKTISYLVSEAAGDAVRHQPLRTIVFLHAFPLQAGMWEANLGALPGGWRGIAPDLCGFGRSPLPDSSSCTMNDLAGDVIDLLDRLEVTDAVLAGLSMGGYVLFEMIRSAPNYASGVILASTRPGGDTEEGKAARKKMIDLLDRSGVDAVAGDMLPKLLGSTAQRERPDLLKQVRHLITSNMASGIRAGIIAMMERRDSTPILQHITVPTLIVAGAEDTLILPAQAEDMHRAIPASACEIVQSAGHLVNLEQAASFNALVRQFLGKL
jgi:pimeloyl-ACP methyl ester carboxylesterase